MKPLNETDLAIEALAARIAALEAQVARLAATVEIRVSRSGR